MMPKELRLAFAMGGGVSLGTFSGAALTETIKLAVLRARTAHGQPIDKVVLDVFSGASAGAMALGLMLRGLVSQTQEEADRAWARLEKQFPAAELDALSDNKRKDLEAAQVAQDIQERMWVDEVSLAGLLGHGDGRSRDLRSTAGLLDLELVEDIARRAYAFPGEVDLARRHLLGERVLFACTLASMLPLLADARGELLSEERVKPSKETGFLGLIQGMTSKVHRDLRVFDLWMRPIQQKEPLDDPSHPRRWFRYHAGDEQEGRIGDLRLPKAWGRIAATTIACGAFPVAFPPVVLERKRFEMGDLWPESLGGSETSGYPFTYVDGGTFNNEPIREAFRLASFLDSQTPNASFERRVIFVDPDASRATESFQVAVHREVALEPRKKFLDLGGSELIRRGTLDRLVVHLPSLALAILDQAQVIEADKIFLTRDRFELRDVFRGHLGNHLAKDANSDQLKGMAKGIEEILKRDRRGAMLPPGTLTLGGELRRVIAEQAEEHLGVLAPAVDTFTESYDLGPDPAGGKWLRALAYVTLDLIMDLEGKRRGDTLVAIAPFVDLSADTPEPLPLPGGRLFGFAGFASPVPGRFEVEVARHCAREYLEACEVIAKVPASPDLPTWTPQHEAQFQQDLEEGLKQMGKRLGDLLRESHLLNLVPGLDAALLHLIASKLESWAAEKAQAAAVEGPPSRISFELRVRVPDRRFELDGQGRRDDDIAPVRLAPGEVWRLITFASWDPESGAWSGEHVTDDGSLAIHRDGLGPLPDSAFCTLQLPRTKAARAGGLLPNPIFEAEVREDDEGEELGADRWWGARPGVEPLDKTLLRS